MQHFNRHNEFVLILSYDITMSCQNKCPYCSRKTELDDSKMLNRPVFDRVIEEIWNFKNENPMYKVELEVLGGEPLLLIDESMEFIDRLQHEDIDVTIFSNFNYPPDSEIMKQLVEYSQTHNFRVKCSWHDSSNIEYIKANIIQCQDFMEEVILLVDDDNLLQVYETFQWIKDNTNCRIGVEELLLPNGQPTFTGFDNELYNLMTSDERTSDLQICTIDDKEYNFAESKRLDFKNISSQYFTLCKLSQLRIKWDGEIISECGYPYRGHINNGINIKEIFCEGYTCYCDTDIYKKLLRPRKRYDS